MSPAFYLFAHVFGALMLLLGLGGILVGSRDAGKLPKLYVALHGVGLLLLLVAGIGYAHKMSWGFPNWMIAKIGCWVVLAAVPTLIKRGILIRTAALLLVLGIGAAAVWLAQAKPF